MNYESNFNGRRCYQLNIKQHVRWDIIRKYQSFSLHGQKLEFEKRLLMLDDTSLFLVYIYNSSIQRHSITFEPNCSTLSLVLSKESDLSLYLLINALQSWVRIHLEKVKKLSHVCVLIIVDSFALIFNLLVIILFLHYRRTLFEYMVLFSVAVADFLVGVLGIMAQVLMYLFLVSGEMKTMVAWKLLGVLSFFGSAFMSIVSVGVLTVDRLTSVQNALRYFTLMTTLRAKFLIALTWITTAAIIFIQGIIYLCISPETELIIRDYLLATFVFIGRTFLVIANLKLYLIVKVKLRRTSMMDSTKSRTQCDSKKNGKTLVTRKVDILKSMEIKIGHKADESLAATSTMSDSVITITQLQIKQSGDEQITAAALKLASHSIIRKRDLIKKSNLCIWMTVLCLD